MASVTEENISTIRLKIPQIRINKENNVGVEESHPHPLNTSKSPIRKTNLVPCSICGILYNSKTRASAVDPETEPTDGEELKNDPNELTFEVIQVLCTQLNIPEFVDTLIFYEMENGIYKTKFPLCQECNESAAILTSLSEQLNKLLLDMAELADSFRKKIGDVKNSAYEFDEECRRRSQQCDTAFGSSSGIESQSDMISRFRSLVLKKGPSDSFETEEVTEESLQNNHHALLDFAHIETVSSVCLSEPEADLHTSEALELPSSDVKAEQQHPREVSPSPAFSPISFHGENFDLEMDPSLPVVNNDSSNNFSDVDLGIKVKNVVSTKRAKSRGRPPKQRSKSWNTNSIAKRKSNQSVKRLKKKQLKKSVSGKQNVLPVKDREGYAAMLKLGIPFKRVEVSLTRLEVTDRNVVSPENPSLKTSKLTKEQRYTAEEDEVKADKRAPVKVSVPDFYYDEIKDGEDDDKVEEKTMSDDPDYCPKKDWFPENVTFKCNSKNSDKIMNRRGRSRIHSSTDLKKELIHTESQTLFEVPVVRKKIENSQCTKCDKDFHDPVSLARHIRWEHTNISIKHNKQQESADTVRKCLNRTKKDENTKVEESKLFTNELLSIPSSRKLRQISQKKQALSQVKIKRTIPNPENQGEIEKSNVNSKKYGKVLSTAVKGKNGQMVDKGFDINKIKDGNGKFQCLTCKKTYNRLEGVQKHIRSSHTNLSELNGNSKIQPHCTSFKITKTDRGTKMYGPVEFEQLEDGQYRCLSVLCQRKLFKSREAILLHFRRTHLKRFNTTTNVANVTKKNITKTYVTADGKIFYKKTELLRTEVGKWKCGTCDKNLSKKSSLLAHIERLHAEDSSEPFKCQYCNKRFNLKILLDSHEITHLNKNNVLCKTSGKSLKHCNSLASHNRQAYKEEKGNECNICGKKFYITREFLLHKKAHTNDISFTCDFSGCGKSLTSVKTLRAHKKLHSKDSSVHKCSRCKSTFHNIKSLTYHLNTKHAEKSLKLRSNDKPPQLSRQDIIDDTAKKNHSRTHEHDLRNDAPPQLVPFYYQNLQEDNNEIEENTWNSRPANVPISFKSASEIRKNLMGKSGLETITVVSISMETSSAEI